VRRRMIVLAMLLATGIPGMALAESDELNELRTSAPNHEWLLTRSDDRRQIKTWAKQEEGKRLRSFRAEGIWDTSLNALARAYTDIDNLPRWYWETKEARLLRKVSDTEYYYYMRFNAPLNLPDRDAVFHAVIEPYSPKRGYWQIKVNAVPDYMPPKPGMVRVVAQDLYARITPLGKNQVKFESEGYVDPGGSVLPGPSISCRSVYRI